MTFSFKPLFLTLCLGSTAALADEFYVNAPAISAIIYPDGGQMTRSFDLDLPAGQHRIHLPMVIHDLETYPNFTTNADIKLLGTSLQTQLSPPFTRFYSDEQTRLWTDIEATDDQIAAIEAQIEDLELDLSALDAQLAFIHSATAPDEGPERLSDLATLVFDKTTEIQRTRLKIQRSIRDQNEQITDLRESKSALERDLDQLHPPTAEQAQLTLLIDVPTAQSATITFPDWGTRARWAMSYDVFLDTQTASQITIDRNLFLQLDGQPLLDVPVILSTAKIWDAIGPAYVPSGQAFISEPEPVRMESSREMGHVAAMAMDPEPMVMMEESAAGSNIGELFLDGQTVKYAFPQGLRLVSGETVFLKLDTLTFPATQSIVAVPRRDDTAFFMAEFVNETREPILNGNAKLYRDDSFVGVDRLDTIPAGQTAKLPFGPVESLQLRTVFARNETGDTGLLTKSNQREQSLTLVVENLSDTAHDVRVLYGLPYSEQEDLEIDITSAPRPTERDVDDRRGVSAWDIQVPPRARRDVNLTIEMNWPEGWDLNWRP